MMNRSAKCNLTVLIAALLLGVPSIAARAGNLPHGLSAQLPIPASAQVEGEPPFHAYKGVALGMSADEVHQKLGEPTEKGDKRDFYFFSEDENADVFYQDRKVLAISINYVGSASQAPNPKEILGLAVEPKADGSIYRRVRYSGCWVSYRRSAGSDPLITVTMQELQGTRKR